MFYTTDDNTHNRPGVTDVAPAAWLESDKDTHEDVIIEHFYEYVMRYDIDFGYSGTRIFVFEDGTAYELEFDMYWTEDDLYKEYTYEEIPLEKAPKWMHKKRDWL